MKDNKLLNELVRDCVTYRLTETEAIDYIKKRSGRTISARSYNRRKAFVKSDTRTNIWMNHFTRVGFVQSHIGHLSTINKIRDDSMQQLQREINKPNRDERKILALKDSIIESTKLLVGLDMGSPIIAAIKAKLEQQQKEQEEPTTNLTTEKKKKKKVLN